MRLFAGTEFDRPPTCERCGELEDVCECPPEPTPKRDPGKQTARLAVEKRKKGKTVTVVRGLSAAGSERAGLLTKLKSACGAGGTLKDEELEIQGNNLDRVRAELTKSGYRTKG